MWLPPTWSFPSSESESQPERPTRRLPEEAFNQVVMRFKEQLGERVTDVRATDRLRNSVARLVDPEGTMGQEMQRVYRLVDRDYEVPKKVSRTQPAPPDHHPLE